MNTFLQPDWNVLYVRWEQGSVTLLTRYLVQEGMGEGQNRLISA